MRTNERFGDPTPSARGHAEAQHFPAASITAREAEAASAGFYEHKLNAQKFPRLQLRTVKDLMDGKGIERPGSASTVDETFKNAPKAKTKGQAQGNLEL